MEDKDSQVLIEILKELQVLRQERLKEHTLLSRFCAFVAIVLAGLSVCIVWGFLCYMGVWP